MVWPEYKRPRYTYTQKGIEAWALSKLCYRAASEITGCDVSNLCQKVIRQTFPEYFFTKVESNSLKESVSPSYVRTTALSVPGVPTPRAAVSSKQQQCCGLGGMVITFRKLGMSSGGRSSPADKGNRNFPVPVRTRPENCVRISCPASVCSFWRTRGASYSGSPVDEFMCAPPPLYPLEVQCGGWLGKFAGDNERGYNTEWSGIPQLFPPQCPRYS